LTSLPGVVNVEPEPPEVLERFYELYRQFVGPGDLAFDIGANIGENTELLARAGARVVAVEPLEECAAVISRGEGVHVLQRAVGAEPGQLELMVCHRSLDNSTVSQEWIDALAAEGILRGRWEERRTVEVCTVDELIEEFGEPDFVKVDVEGHELEVLAGMGRSVRALSLETHACLGDKAVACIRRLGELGFGSFAVSVGHSAVLSDWIGAAEVEREVREVVQGDLYARR
jgi:FkbM family methyltransferase